MNEWPCVSIILVSFNSQSDLERCLPSLLEQDYPHYEVVVVDNASTDDTVAFLDTEFPDVRVICSPDNLGYAGANNIGFQETDNPYIAVLNPDTVVDNGWLKALISVAASSSQIGLVTPKITMLDRPDILNTCGNDITFTGLTFCRGLEEPAHLYTQQETVAAVSGAAFVIKRAVLDDIGGFDERFFLYYEETDLSLRAALAGYQCVYVPTAVVGHDYVFGFSPQKGFLQERNRYFSLLKTLRWRTFLAIIPSLLLAEILAWGYSILQGTEHIKSKWRSYGWLWRHREEVMAARQAVQQLRRVPDHAIVARFGYRITMTQTASPLLVAVLTLFFNPISFVFSRISRAIIIW